MMVIKVCLGTRIWKSHQSSIGGECQEFGYHELEQYNTIWLFKRRMGGTVGRCIPTTSSNRREMVIIICTSMLTSTKNKGRRTVSRCKDITRWDALVYRDVWSSICCQYCVVFLVVYNVEEFSPSSQSVRDCEQRCNDQFFRYRCKVVSS